MPTLVFIDTNILLDFYRVHGNRDSLDILKLIDKNHSRIITGHQVEVEFKKNRQAILALTMSNVKAAPIPTLPGILGEKQAAKTIASCHKEIKGAITRLQRSVESILKHPMRNDVVYRTAHRLFRSSGQLNLRIGHNQLDEIHKRAQRRFNLGHPPRKDKNPTLGDAINWEWILECAKDNAADVVIVSRDGDFGFPEESLVNDWLSHEFRKFVGVNRKLSLTPRLAVAFRTANIAVTKTQARLEVDQLNQLKMPAGLVNLDAYREFLRLLNTEQIASIAAAGLSGSIPTPEFYPELMKGFASMSLRALKGNNE